VRLVDVGVMSTPRIAKVEDTVVIELLRAEVFGSVVVFELPLAGFDVLIGCWKVPFAEGGVAGVVTP
jgi:hypothetical protein